MPPLPRRVPSLTLSSAENYTLAITATGADYATNTGLDALFINGQFGIAGDEETEINMTATTATDFADVELLLCRDHRQGRW